MLFVKTIETEEENIIKFEVLSRCPFIKHIFTMNDLEFREMFKFINNENLNSNETIGYDNEGESKVYVCVERDFFEKMIWWNYNINKAIRLYNAIYESKNKHTLEDQSALEDLKDDYYFKFCDGLVVFFKDMKRFSELFDTAEKVEDGS